MKSRTLRKVLHALLLMATLALLVVGPAFARGGHVAGLPAPYQAPVTIELCASSGSITMPDAQVVPIWGYSMWNGSSCDPAQLPGPVMRVTAGDDLTVILHNQLPHTTSIIFPGQDIFPVSVSAPSGGTASYNFIANDPGTYLYESGTNAHRQVPMGLYGALIVDSATPGQAYNDPASVYDEEAVVVLSEIDPFFNLNPLGFNLLNYLPLYFLINGEAYPDTNPINVSPGDRLLLRYVNAGLQQHTMALLGQHQNLLARDAYPLNFPLSMVSETIPSGATVDAIVDIPLSAAGDRYPLYNRQLRLVNRISFPGGMLTFVNVATGPAPTPTNTPLPTDTPTATPTTPPPPTDTPTATPTTPVPPTNTPTATTAAPPTNTPTPSNTPGASDLIFADGFDNGNFSAWSNEVDTEGDLNVTAAAALQGSFGMAALIDNFTGMYVQDNSPTSEARYRARFYFDPNGIGSLNVLSIFGARTNATEVARIDFRRIPAGHQVRVVAQSDAGGPNPTSWFTISDAPHSLEIDWIAASAPGANNGSLSFWIDGVLVATLSGIDNDTLRVELARLGPSTAISFVSGTVYFDTFVSRRLNYIGP